MIFANELEQRHILDSSALARAAPPRDLQRGGGTHDPNSQTSETSSVLQDHRVRRHEHVSPLAGVRCKMVDVFDPGWILPASPGQLRERPTPKDPADRVGEVDLVIACQGRLAVQNGQIETERLASSGQRTEKRQAPRAGYLVRSAGCFSEGAGRPRDVDRMAILSELKQLPDFTQPRVALD